MKKTSINLEDSTWRRFRAQCMLEGREAGVTLAEIIEAWLKKKEVPRGKR